MHRLLHLVVVAVSMHTTNGVTVYYCCAVYAHACRVMYLGVLLVLLVDLTTNHGCIVLVESILSSLLSDIPHASSTTSRSGIGKCACYQWCHCILLLCCLCSCM